MRRSSISRWVAAITVCFVLAGCGGGGTSSPSVASPTPTSATSTASAAQPVVIAPQPVTTAPILAPGEQVAAAVPVFVPADAPRELKPPLVISPRSAPSRADGAIGPAVLPSGVGYSPAQMRHAYGVDALPNGGQGQTIAIVDAYGSPTIATDYASFCSAAGLPQTTLTVVYSGGQPASTDQGWGLETSLDVEWAHAIAPNAAILLVVTPTANSSDLLAGVDYAVGQGCHQISLSWGGSEFAGQTSLDSHFNHSGVSYLVSSGDNGAGQSWPASSQYVTSVGGTTLGLDASGNLISESAWSGSGGGLSAFVSEPSYQASSSAHSVCNGARGGPDVAWNADPQTGVMVYDSTGYQGHSGWFELGGTSASAPQWAGLIAIINAQRASASLQPITNFSASAYAVPLADYTDITFGSNGHAATAGYDLATGLGSPRAVAIAAALGPTPTPTPTPSPSPSPSPVYTNTTVTVGLGPAAQGWFSRFQVDVLHPGSINGSTTYLAALDWGQVTANGYPSMSDASTHIAAGDIDGDGIDEFVVGTGAGGQGRVYVFKNKSGGAQLMATIQMTGYASYVNSADARTYPACVDIDGDGQAEIVIGTGPGGGGWAQVWKYNKQTSTFTEFGGTPTGQGYVQVDWPQYNGSPGAEVHPAGGYINGRGQGKPQQLVMGLAAGGHGWMQIWGWNGSVMVPYALPSSANGWLQYQWSTYDAAADAPTWPACGDLDGDGWDDIVVGGGDGGQGWLEIFRSVQGVPTHSAWRQVAWAGYDGSGHAPCYPAVGDLDGDGRADIVVGLGAGSGGWLYVLRTAVSGWTDSWARPNWPAYTGGANATTWPAIARQRPSP